jgi:hypothetical protein
MRIPMQFMVLFGLIGLLFGYAAGENLRSCAAGLGVGMILGLIVGGIVQDEIGKKSR